MAKETRKKPKMKTNRAAAKRFSKTGTGKISFGAKGHRHGLSNKSRKHNRKLKASRTMTKGDQKLVYRLIPYL
jgi:large subunit ribosomal protein L35